MFFFLTSNKWTPFVAGRARTFFKSEQLVLVVVVVAEFVVFLCTLVVWDKELVVFLTLRTGVFASVPLRDVGKGPDAFAETRQFVGKKRLRCLSTHCHNDMLVLLCVARESTTPRIPNLQVVLILITVRRVEASLRRRGGVNP